jgi:IS5 family transposase
MAFWNLVLMSTAVTAATAAAPSAEIATTAIQEDEVETPTVMSTAVTAATAAAPAAKIVRTATQEDEDEDDDFLPITHLRAANPRTVKNQKQKRRQPQSAAPTTKGYKAIARPSKRNHMESVRIAENRVQGKTKDGKHANYL